MSNFWGPSQLESRVERQTYKKLNEAFAYLSTARDLTKAIFGSGINIRKLNPTRQDEKVLCALIRHEVKERAKTGWRLDEEGISTIVNHYLVLRDYNLGEHKLAFRRIVRSYGVEFLSDSEYSAFVKIPITDSDKAQEEFLKQ